MKGYVYILQGTDSRFYIGSTDDPDRRMRQHENGHTHTTHRMGIKKLVFIQIFNSLAEARKIELKLKKLKRRDYIEKIVKDGYIKMT